MKPIRLLARVLSLAALVALLGFAAWSAHRRAQSTAAPVGPASIPAATPSDAAPASAGAAPVVGAPLAPEPVFLFGFKSGPLQLPAASRPVFLPSSKIGSLSVMP